jgi:hypothetical protein
MGNIPKAVMGALVVGLAAAQLGLPQLDVSDGVRSWTVFGLGIASPVITYLAVEIGARVDAR